MWVMTSYGAFFPALRPADTVPPGDDRTMQVRARRRVDLHRLRQLHMHDLGPTYEVPDSDYEFRANCTPEALAAAMARIAMDIDYVKFKPTTERYRDDQLHGAYLDVWAVLLRRLGRAPVWTDRRGRRTRR